MRPAPLFLVAVCAVAALPLRPVCGQDGSPVGMFRAAHAVSSSRRFFAAGPVQADNVAAVTRADDFLARVSQVLGRELPFPRLERIAIQLQYDARLEAGRVRSDSEWTADARLAQQLTVANPSRADAEDVLEGLCRLLVTRAAAHLQPASARSGRPARPPDWLAVGLAQDLLPELRQRNRSVVLARWRAGRRMPFADVLACYALPDGRYPDKAVCGVAVSWLRSLPAAPALFDGILKQVAGGEEPGMEAVLRYLPDAGAPRDLEMHWDLWVMHFSLMEGSSGGLSVEAVAALDRALQVYPVEVGVLTGDALQQPLSLEDLLQRRRTGWAGDVASRLQVRLDGLAVGQPPELVRVIDLYARFLAQFPVRPGRWWAAGRERGASDRALRRLLDRAREEHGALRRQAVLSSQYLEEVEAERRGAVSPAAADGSEEERRAYLDRLEQERAATPAP